MQHQSILCGSPHLRSDCVGTQLNRSSISIRHRVQITWGEGGRSRAILGGRVEAAAHAATGSLQSPPLCPSPSHPCLPHLSDFLPLPPETTPSYHTVEQKLGEGEPLSSESAELEASKAGSQRWAGGELSWCCLLSIQGFTKNYQKHPGPFGLWVECIIVSGSSLPDLESYSCALCHGIFQVPAFSAVLRIMPCM